MQSQHFQLDGEHETGTGWLYTFTLNLGDEPTHHELTLSWVDHEHLVGGAIAPERVAHAAIALAIEHLDPPLPQRFDVSSIRRRVDGFDTRLKNLIDAPL